MCCADLARSGCVHQQNPKNSIMKTVILLQNDIIIIDTFDILNEIYRLSCPIAEWS